jgi:hypothetical protein
MLKTGRLVDWKTKKICTGRMAVGSSLALSVLKVCHCAVFHSPCFVIIHEYSPLDSSGMFHGPEETMTL